MFIPIDATLITIEKEWKLTFVGFDFFFIDLMAENPM